MAVPLQIFTSARAALEATRGTDLTPTRIIYAEQFTWEPSIATVRPEELTGGYEGFRSASAGVEINRFSMSGRISFNDAIWHHNLFVGPLLTGVGGGADKVYAITPSNTADNVKTATVQLGDSQAISAGTPGVKLNYCLGDTYHLHWEKNDDGAVLFDSSFLVASTATQITAFTGSLSDRTVIPATSALTQTYIDATTIGTTVDNNVTSVDWTLNLNPVPFYALNGTQAASAIYRPHHRTWTATIVRQFVNSNEWTIYNNKAERKIRIKTLGAVLGGSNYTLQVDLYGVYTGRSYTDVDGIITETLTLEPIYDAGIVGSFNTSVTSTEATIS